MQYGLTSLEMLSQSVCVCHVCVFSIWMHGPDECVVESMYVHSSLEEREREREREGGGGGGAGGGGGGFLFHVYIISPRL